MVPTDTALGRERNWLADELNNFEEIARYLNPSSGEIPDLPGVDIHGFSLPLRKAIGGDHIVYVDFKHRYDLAARSAEAEREGRREVARNLRKLDSRAGILVADVSGHRMTDALIAAMLHQAFLLGVSYELDMSGEVTTRLFEHLNTRFYRTTAINKYFTMIYGEISGSGKFRFVSSGHQPPAVFSREYGRFMRISRDRLVSFPPVGLLPTSADPDDNVNPSLYQYKKRYEVNEINLLARGDILLLHTDGFSDHVDEEFFPKRVEQVLVETGHRPSHEICDRLREELLAAGEPRDDVSAVVIRKTG